VSHFPAHTSEVLPWHATTKRGTEIDHYTATIPPRIASVELVLSRDANEACRQAEVDVRVLDQSTAISMTSLEPFLLRTEALASSKIEQEFATVDQFARAQVGISTSKNALTVLAAADGLRLLVDQAHDGVTLPSILAAHRPLVEHDPVDSRYAGQLRDVQNWIGGSDHSPRGALHVPPHPNKVLTLMDDLLAYSARTDLDPIAQSVVAHAQFESIHPFTDGNGRIGRSLINAIWRYRGLTRTVAVPVAAAIVADRERYFSVLDKYRAGDVTPIIVYLAECTSRASREALVSAAKLAELPQLWRGQANARAGSTTSRLVNLLLERPIVHAYDVATMLGASRASAYRALDALEQAGVLRKITQSKRDMTWAAGEVLDEADLLIDRLRKV